MKNSIQDKLWNILNTLTVEEKPDWDTVSQSWVQTLLDCESGPTEKMVFKLGDAVRRQQRNSLIEGIDKVLAALSTSEPEDLFDNAAAA